MATPTPVPVRLPPSKVPTKTMVRDIIATFFPLEWPHVDPSTLDMSHRVNFANAHCPVSRPPPASPNSAKEPLKVFIKFHEQADIGMDIFVLLAPTKPHEAQLCADYGQLPRSIGAKVHGFFQTEDGTMGRIDEFLDARNMEPYDVEDAATRADVGKAMASFAALKSAAVPRATVAEYYDAVIPALKRYQGSEKLKMLANETGLSMDALVDYDFAARVKNAVQAMQHIKGKEGWCIHDVQYMNTMVRHNPRPDESRVALIDFELGMRNYRGFDIGGHFMQKLFKWFDEESKVVDCRAYSEDEKRHFCEEYAKEWNRVTGDSDTGEQVLKEADLGYLLAIAFDVHNMLWYMDKENVKDRLDVEGLNKLYDEFATQYTKLGLPPVA